MKRAELYVKNALAKLQRIRLGDGIELVEGHQFRTMIDSQSYQLIAQIIRVYDETGHSMAFRAISRDGIENLPADSKPHIILDNRPNVEAEIDSELYDEATLSNAYLDAYSGSTNAEGEHITPIVLTPVREGSLGPTDEINGYGPFTSPGQRYAEDNWDLLEEMEAGEAWAYYIQNGDLSGLDNLKDEIAEHHQAFALPLAQLLHADITTLFTELHARPETGDLSDESRNFFEMDPVEYQVSLGFDHFTVDQLVAYPYASSHGMLYIRLFRVWDATHTTYEVVRILQTQPKKIGDPSMMHFDGLRLDSGCHDGKHSLDEHCDCAIQLAETINGFLDEGKDGIVVQLTDHEGKSWGSAWKGLTLGIMRQYNDDVLATKGEDATIGNPVAAAAMYGALGVSPDKRDYRAAQAVLKVLNVHYIDELMMGNQDKILAIEAIGIGYNTSEAVRVPAGVPIGREALRGLNEKHLGLVSGVNGTVVYSR